MIELSDIGEDIEGFTQTLSDLLDGHALASGHPFDGKRRGLAAHHGGAFAGGALFNVSYGWCFLKYLAIDPGKRGLGVGSRLVEALETRVRAEGALGIWLDTFGYQAAPFYLRHGFHEFGRLDGPIPDKDRIFMKKTLEGTP